MDVAYIYTWKRSAPMRFFYQICETKRQRIKVPNSFATTEETRLELNKNVAVVNGDAKSKDDVCVKIESNSMSAKVVLETRDEYVEKRNGVQNGTHETVQNDGKVPFGVGLTKSTTSCKETLMELVKDKKAELNGEKSLVKPNALVNGGHQKVRPDRKSVDVDNSTQENKSDKSESGDGLKTSENKVNKTDTVDGKKQVHMTVNGSLQTPKEKPSTNESNRLFLNPISGQLEAVPSTNPTKSNDVPMENKTEMVNGVKKSVVEQKGHKSLSDDQKEIKKSNVNLLKNFRKDKTTGNKDAKTDGKSGSENSLTITTVGKVDKVGDKPEGKASVEIKPEKKESEYDFDGTSPPSKIIPLQEYSKMSKSQKYGSSSEKQPQNSWMSLQDFRLQMLKENNSNVEEAGKKDKRKSVPSLFRIGAEANKKSSPKATPNGKPAGEKVKTKMSPTIINIKTESEDSSKTEIKIELPGEQSPVAIPKQAPKPIKLESKGGEQSTKEKEDDTHKNVPSVKTPPPTAETKKVAEEKEKKEETATEAKKQPVKRSNQEKQENDNPKKAKPSVEETKNDNFGAIDLSTNDTSPRSRKNPLENLMDLASKSGTPKTDENMVEALISAAQKQSIEPLLKIPQYSQNLKNSVGQGSPPQAKAITSTDISQALQFFKDLRSDIKVLEAKSQLSPNSFLDQFAQKSTNLEPIQLYQQHIDLIRRLKRQQMAINDVETPQRKQPKLSPTGDSKRKTPPEANSKMSEEAAAQLKSSLERTLSQIQEQMELQSRMVAAQNYKNLPALLQFYNRPPPAYCPAPPSPSKSSHKLKSSSRSPTSQKSPPISRTSPQNLTPPGSGALPLAMTNAESQFFSAQKYNHLINAGLNSEMTFHQMFQNYLNQQDKMNQIKHSPGLAKKTQALPPKTVPELFYSSQVAPKKPEAGTVSAAQKT
ncbi:hypothetical protein RUM43_004442 [Polyplax serrata]|uniref:Uncharacterized protein n=1 Tax=Polyplax serrata TaxID=468196 RepID=A0AAN8XLW7_POLSC